MRTRARKPAGHSPRHLLAQGSAERPEPGNFLKKWRTISYGSSIETTGGSHVARIPCPVHHCHRAVFHLRVYHQPEHGTGASPKEDIRDPETAGMGGDAKIGRA